MLVYNTVLSMVYINGFPPHSIVMQRTETERHVYNFLEANGVEVSDTAPRAILSAVNMLFDRVIGLTGKPTGDITPKDLTDVLENEPELVFLKQIIPCILDE